MWRFRRSSRPEPAPRAARPPGPRRAILALAVALLWPAAAFALTPPPDGQVPNDVHDAYVITGGVTLALASAATIYDAVALRSATAPARHAGGRSFTAGALAVGGAAVFSLMEGDGEPLPSVLVYSNITVGVLAMVLGSTLSHAGPAKLSVVPAATSAGRPALALAARW